MMKTELQTVEKFLKAIVLNLIREGTINEKDNGSSYNCFSWHYAGMTGCASSEKLLIQKNWEMKLPDGGTEDSYEFAEKYLDIIDVPSEKYRPSVIRSIFSDNELRTFMEAPVIDGASCCA